MPQNTRRKVMLSLFCLAPLAILYGLSKTVWSGVYFFEWSARHAYYYVWLIVLGLLWLGQTEIAIGLSAANPAGVIIGQVLGDVLQARGMARIGPDTVPDMAHQLSLHPAVWIWLICLVLGGLGGLLWKRYRKPRFLAGE